MPSNFVAKLHRLRWDDHRYYHQSRINQTLHFVSALSFVAAYAVLPADPALSGLIGWLIGMVTRQSGHIFFEPRGYDHVNHATDAYKESIKVGYNMRRKAILIAIWLALPLLLLYSRSVFGLVHPRSGLSGYLHELGLLWLALGIAGIAVRTVHLFALRGPVWGLAWAAKVLTDPFHNIRIYWRSPIALAHGERFDPIFPADPSVST